MPLVLIVLLFAVMYFMMIRPQQKRRREAMEMQNSLGFGDKIVTIGGLHATVVSVQDDVVVVEIADGVHVTFARPAIAKVVKAEQAETAEPVAADTADADAEPVVEPDPVPASDPEPIQSPVVETRKNKD